MALGGGLYFWAAVGAALLCGGALAALAFYLRRRSLGQRQQLLRAGKGAGRAQVHSLKRSALEAARQSAQASAGAKGATATLSAARHAPHSAQGKQRGQQGAAWQANPMYPAAGRGLLQ